MKVHETIDEELADWIRAQPVFFNATAPLDTGGHINLSPRGLDSLRITGPKQVIIIDRTGSGNETAAHLAENGRLTIMFCAFEGAPRILRLYGRGEVVLPDDSDWQTLRQHFPDDIPGVRQIFRLDITRVQTSCGFAVPLMNFEKQRTDLDDWARKKGEVKIRQYQAEKNTRSIDGLPAPRPKN
ncbi:pyridoxamine 5'-phosphate oxidase family protein [Kaarinaea lacus]